MIKVIYEDDRWNFFLRPYDGTPAHSAQTEDLATFVHKPCGNWTMHRTLDMVKSPGFLIWCPQCEEPLPGEAMFCLSLRKLG